MENPIHDFTEAARQAGLTINKTIIPDGKIHRFKTEDDKSSNKSGWYIFHQDGSPTGIFGDWRTGARHTWSAQPEHELTSAERDEQHRRIELAKSQRQQAETELREQAAAKATKLWARAGTINKKHSYLTSKQICPIGAKQLRNMLVVPLRDIDDALHSLQFIGTDGTKRFLTDGRKRSCFATLGDCTSETLYIVEGWATGCTIQEATESTVIIAFDTGNLRPVAEVLRKKYPDKRLVICADDDHKTHANPGIAKATEAAHAVDGLLAIPTFSDNRPADATDFNDLFQHKGLDAVCECLATAAEVPEIKTQTNNATASNEAIEHASTSTTETYPRLLLPGSIKAPEIPADILPSWACEMVEAVAANTQTSPAASVLLSLSVVATCVQRRFEVAPHGDDSYLEPLCLWTLTALPSGSRKSPILKALADPLHRWEKLMAEKLCSDIAETNATRRVATKRIERLEARAGSADDHDERSNIRDEIKAEIEAMPDEQRPPRLITGDVTPERLQELLVEHREAMALFADEAGIFQVMGGLYSGGQGILDSFLQAYSGTSIRVDRKSRTAHLERPVLTFGLAIQPLILQSVANNKQFHDSGLLARFLFCIPRNTVGHRNVRARIPIPADVSITWRNKVYALLENAEKPPTDPIILPFTPDARECWLDFAQKVENELIGTGKLGQMTEWGAKLPGQCARIAGLIELISNGREAKEVTLDSVERAVRLCGLLVQHAKAAFRLLGADKIETDALHLMSWIKAAERHEFDRSFAQKALEGKFRTVNQLKQAAERLNEWNVLSPELQRKNKNARPSPYYRVNPLLFDKSTKSL